MKRRWAGHRKKSSSKDNLLRSLPTLEQNSRAHDLDAKLKCPTCIWKDTAIFGEGLLSGHIRLFHVQEMNSLSRQQHGDRPQPPHARLRATIASQNLPAIESIFIERAWRVALSTEPFQKSSALSADLSKCQELDALALAELGLRAAQDGLETLVRVGRFQNRFPACVQIFTVRI